MRRSSSVTDDEDSVSSLPVSFLPDINQSLPPPHTFLHPHVKLQKDKGRGETPGSDVCASGVDHCLRKLRQKLEPLTNMVRGEDSETQQQHTRAHMKRRKARIAEENENYTETRSLIELRMGFLSMQYGVLIRWSAGKIHLVVLRKMCTDSFYKTLKVHKESEHTTTRAASPFVSQISSTLNVVGESHAVLHEQAGGTEIALVDPPYRIPRPDVFPPSYLKISVICIEGWKDHRNHYSLQFHTQGLVEKCRLIHHEERGLYVPRMPETMEWEVSSDAQLDILLFEHKRRQKRKRLVRSLPVRVASLTPQASPARPRKLVLPLNEHGAFITLLVAFQSDLGHWLRMEVETRRREETNPCFWKAPFVRTVEIEQDEKERDVLYELCCVW